MSRSAGCVWLIAAGFLANVAAVQVKGARELDTLSDLPRDFRARLAESHEIGLPELERATPSRDGSRKLVFRLADGGRVSAVLMPDGDRVTLCLSTQVGCGFGCAFCLTGTMGVDRNLTVVAHRRDQNLDARERQRLDRRCVEPRRTLALKVLAQHGEEFLGRVEIEHRR